VLDPLKDLRRSALSAVIKHKTYFAICPELNQKEEIRMPLVMLAKVNNLKEKDNENIH
jgi:hypothetical protein